ncbi:RpiB/LacA/LacB family sugar-phosphate isomerase [Candidatus Woesebacteria bacterium]|nr:RpiB/LacA/LacB family sugar-phosphate isomerase [Candidatus Woesebacteria bacterium]
MIYIGADHGGFLLKEELKKWFDQEKIPFEDMGADNLDSTDDYPDFAHAVALSVSKNPDELKGIVICRSGAGVAIVANKTNNIRAVQVTSEEGAQHARSNDDANIIALAGDWTTIEEAKRLVQAFLNTPFGAQEKDQRRIQKILAIENKQ